MPTSYQHILKDLEKRYKTQFQPTYDNKGNLIALSSNSNPPMIIDYVYDDAEPSNQQSQMIYNDYAIDETLIYENATIATPAEEPNLADLTEESDLDDFSYDDLTEENNEDFNYRPINN